MREIAAYSSAIADVALSEPWLGILPIALYGSPDLRDELLPRYIAGRLLPAFALSEPDAGSDAAAITTTARRDGDYYVVNGRKTWTSNCGLADVYVVFARMEEQPGAGGIAAFAVDGRAPGIALEEHLSVLPPHTVGTWTLKNCRVPSHRLIGTPGEGFKGRIARARTVSPDGGRGHAGFCAPRDGGSHLAWIIWCSAIGFLNAVRLTPRRHGGRHRCGSAPGLSRCLATRRNGTKHLARGSHRQIVLDGDGLRYHR
jgi:hypothetical protein